MSKLNFDAIGCGWEIETGKPLPDEVRAPLIASIEAFDGIFSRFRTDSLVAEMSRCEDGGRFEVPAESVPLFDLYDCLHAATRGAVDPLVGRDLELLGYDAEYTLLHDPVAIARYSQQRRNWKTDVQRDANVLLTRRSVVLDVGAAGKGYLVDLVAEKLRDGGIDDFLVDAGGDLVHAGPSPLRVGLEHPADPGAVVGIADLKGRALCASAVNRRAWRGFHHVLDGRTGVPTKDVVATWVIADDAMSADGLATALFFVHPDALRHPFQFEWVRMLADGRVDHSPGFKGEIFYSERMTSGHETG